MIRISLAKGRIASEVFKLFESKGLVFDDGLDSRKLILTEQSGLCDVILVKPGDTAVYVEQGVADCGILGRDIVMEDNPDVYSLFTLPVARCRMVVAGRPDCDFTKLGVVRAATKFTNIARSYFAKRNLPCEIIHLNGSVELGPILGMSDVIVDIVETGSTLRENGLVVLDELFGISPVFVVNKAALKLRHDRIEEISRILQSGQEDTP